MAALRHPAGPAHLGSMPRSCRRRRKRGGGEMQSGPSGVPAARDSRKLVHTASSRQRASCPARLAPAWIPGRPQMLAPGPRRRCAASVPLHRCRLHRCACIGAPASVPPASVRLCGHGCAGHGCAVTPLPPGGSRWPRGCARRRCLAGDGCAQAKAVGHPHILVRASTSSGARGSDMVIPRSRRRKAVQRLSSSAEASRAEAAR